MKVKSVYLHNDLMLMGGLGSHKTISGDKPSLQGIELFHDLKSQVILYKMKRGATEIRGFIPITNVAQGVYELDPKG